MKDIVRRPRRLEQLNGLGPETWETRQLRARLEAGRRRCNLPPLSTACLAALRGRSIVEILAAGRQRARRLATECEETAPQRGCGDDRDRGCNEQREATDCEIGSKGIPRGGITVR